MGDLIRYDEHADKTEAAFNAFARVYKLTNPPPVAPAARQRFSFTLVGLFIVTVAAVLVSGQRTIDEFGSVEAFVMLEVFAILGSYILTTLSPEGRHSRELIIVALTFVAVVMVGANVHSIARSSGMFVSEWINTVILMLVAVSAPILTMINGHLAAVEWKKLSKERSSAFNHYEAQMARWREKLNAEWNANRSNYGVSIRVSKAESSAPAIPSTVPMERPVEQGAEYQGGVAGYSKTRNAMDIALDYYRSNPEALSVDPRQLEQTVGVKKSTLYNARKIVQEEFRS